MKSHEELTYEANNAFYIWETKKYGDNSPLSDADRELWVHAFSQGYRSLEVERTT
jgi:hypothetical protein